ncbi:MAG: hypothetical protein WC521_09080 [Bdellovibrionales bacterium]|jgi:hypothetical protein
MLDKEVLGAISVLLVVIAYIPYYRSLFKGTTKPHIFSWVIFGSCHAVGFIGPYLRGAGAGSWSSAITSVNCFVIAALAFSRGEKSITKSDWVSFILALFIIPVWYLTKDPLGAVLLALLIFSLGIYPTARKSVVDPYSENIFTWAVGSVRYLISFLAVEHYLIVTSVFQLGTFFMNTIVVILLVWCRYKQSKPISVRKS